MRYNITYIGKGKRCLALGLQERAQFSEGKTLECSPAIVGMISGFPDTLRNKFVVEPIREVKVINPDIYATGEEKPKDKRQRDVLDKDKPKRTLANVIEDKRRSPGRKQLHNPRGSF